MASAGQATSGAIWGNIVLRLGTRAFATDRQEETFVEASQGIMSSGQQVFENGRQYVLGWRANRKNDIAYQLYGKP
jgi:hypothetical protein